MKTWFRVTSVVLIAVLLAACRAQHRVVIPTEGPPRLDTSAVQPEDVVLVKLKSGTTLYFEVAQVRPEALVSTRGQEVRFDARPGSTAASSRRCGRCSWSEERWQCW